MSDYPATFEDETAWSIARQEFLADERDRVADERDALADKRDAEADEREAAADLRESDVVAGRFNPDDALELREADRAGRAAARRVRDEAALARADARVRRADARDVRAAGAPTILAQLFADIARQLFAAASLDDVLRRVATVATEVVPGADYASITVMSKRGPVTPIATDEIASGADARQYECGEGPCLDALMEREIYTPSVSTDPRWPRLAAHELKVRTVASFGLFESWDAAGPRGPRVSLNLYGTGADAVPEDGREIGTMLAAYGTVALSVAAERERVQQRDEQLHEALLSRDVIGQAKGILMERDRVTADEAFNILRRTSQAYNRKLRDVAARLAMTGELPPPTP